MHRQNLDSLESRDAFDSRDALDSRDRRHAPVRRPLSRTVLIALIALNTLGVLAASACAPDTIIRRTAFINAPQAPVREGLALDKGQVRVSAHLSGVNTATTGSFFFFEPGSAEVGDPGVLIPDFQLGASLWAGLPGGLEFGGQFHYASMRWSDPNVNGVLPFPNGLEEDLFIGGLGLRLNVKTGEPRLALALMAELNFATIPEAIFICESTDTSVCSGERLVGEEAYRFDRIERDGFFLPNMALQLGWKFGDEALANADPYGDRESVALAPGRLRFMPYLLLGLQSSVTNTGFENDIATLPNDSLEALWMGYLGVGIDLTLEGLVIGTSVILPIEGEEAIDFGLVFNFRIGGQFQ